MAIQENVLDFNKICRLCLTEDSVMSSIYNDDGKHSSSVSLQLRIMACVSVELNSLDGLPSHICTTCLCQVDGWYKFKELCETADAFLKQCIKNEPVQVDTITQIRNRAQEIRQFLSSPNLVKVDGLDTLDELNSTDKTMIGKKKRRQNIQNLLGEEQNVVQTGNLKSWTFPGYNFWAGDENAEGATTSEANRGSSTGDVKTKRKLNYTDVTYDHPVPRKDGKVHQCRICQKYLRNVTTRNRHELEKHPPPLPCEFCSKTFTTVLTYHTHRNIHLGLTKYKCKYCGKHLGSRSNLEDHEKVHTGERPVECPKCDKTFSSTSNLRVHLKFHAGVKTHFCHICGKGHVTTGNLKLHVKRHSNERSHVCHICGKGFNGRSELKKHIESHNAEKNYSCQYCTQKLKTYNSLKRHVNIQHLKVRPYKCDFCLREFGRRENLKEHMQVHLLKKEFFCEACSKQFANLKVLQSHRCVLTGNG